MGNVPLRGPVLDLGTGDGHFASVTYTVPIDAGIDVLWRDLTEAARRVGVYRCVGRAANGAAFPRRRV